MSWYTVNAINTIAKYLKTVKERKIPIWPNVIESLKLLKEQSENGSKAYVNDNLLYAKLLAIQLRQEVSHFQNVKEAIANVGNGLNKPLEYHIEMLRMELNNADDMNYFRELGLEFERDTKENRDKKIETLETNEKEIVEKVKKFNNYDKVEKSFYNSANDFLKDTDNYK